MEDKIKARIEALKNHGESQSKIAIELANQLEAVRANMIQTQGAIIELSLMIKPKENTDGERENTSKT